MPVPREGARYHGDQAAAPGMLDFAVNVRASGPPRWLRDRLAARLDDLGSYPSRADERRAVVAVAARHGRNPDEVLLLAGAAEGFAMLPRLRPRRVALIAPCFTEPEAVFAEAGVPVDHVLLAPPFTLGHPAIPQTADLVVVGNPTNPTGVLHSREDLLALRGPGRLLVVDEAFADAVPDEPQSLAALSAVEAPDVLILRSLTKTWSLAGLRVGYALGHPDVLRSLSAGRAHWPVSTLALEAIAVCNTPEAVAWSREQAVATATLREQQAAGLRRLGLHVVDGAAPYLLVSVPDAELVRKHLEANDIAVRRCDTFVGLDGEYLRVAVRPEWPLLVEKLAEVLT